LNVTLVSMNLVTPSSELTATPSEGRSGMGSTTGTGIGSGMGSTTGTGMGSSTTDSRLERDLGKHESFDIII
jgi:hypothetical protein